MKEKGIAIVVCVIAAAVVVYAIVFLTPESTNLQVVPDTIQEEARIQEAKLSMQGRDFEAEKQARITKYRQEHNLTKKREPGPMEQWMQDCLREGVLKNLDHTNHEVAIDPVVWRLASIDHKWLLMKCVQVYFDGYATIVSSTSGRPLAKYTAWSGIQILD